MPSDAEHYWMYISPSEMFRTHSHVHALKQQTRRPICIPTPWYSLLCLRATNIFHWIPIDSTSRFLSDNISKVLDIEGIPGEIHIIIVYWYDLCLLNTSTSSQPSTICHPRHSRPSHRYHREHTLPLPTHLHPTLRTVLFLFIPQLSYPPSVRGKFNACWMD